MEQEADLVIVDNPNENLFIYDFAKENSIDVWLGILENVSKIKISWFIKTNLFRKLLRMSMNLCGLMGLK